MRTSVVGGQLAGPDGLVAADLLCEDGVIAAITAPGGTGPADEIVDARGHVVFPGFIDPHVHSRDPGSLAKEDFAHSTKAALMAGVTTVFEMPNAVPPVTNVNVLRDRAERHESAAHTDFGLWGQALGAENVDDLPGLYDAGVVGVKVFWGYALDRESKRLVYNTGTSGRTQWCQPRTRVRCSRSSRRRAGWVDL